jgi:hypothetical protein
MDRYWVGGTATWDATVGTKWAATSGGIGGESVPTASDDVYFTNLSTGVCTLSAVSPTNFKNLDCTGFTGSLICPAGSTLVCNGLVFKLSSGMTFTQTSTTSPTQFRSTSGLCLITTAGKLIGSTSFDAVGGAWQFQDNYTQSTGRGMTLTNGSLDLNGKTYNGIFVSSFTTVRELKCGGATMNLPGAGTVWSTTNATNLTMPGASTLTVNITSTTAASKTLSHNGPAIGTINVVPDTAPGNSAGIVSFNNLICDTFNVAGPKYIAMNNVTKYIGQMNINGTAGNPVTMYQITTPGTRVLLNLKSRSKATYSDMTDLLFRGPSMFASNSTQSNCAGLQMADTSRGLLVADGF